jgi:hypothetical protein
MDKWPMQDFDKFYMAVQRLASSVLYPASRNPNSRKLTDAVLSCFGLRLVNRGKIVPEQTIFGDQ